jgi:DNA replication protein DnaC
MHSLRLFSANSAKRIVARRIQEAKLPKVKTLEDFHFEEAPLAPAAQIRKLAEGGYLSRSRLNKSALEHSYDNSVAPE